MTKRRFELGPTPEPTSPMFNKFGMGDTPSDPASETQPTPETTPPAKASPKGKKKPPAAKAGDETKSTEFVKCQFPAGVPQAFEPRVVALSKTHNLELSYLRKALILKTKEHMSHFDVSTISGPLPDPKITKPTVQSAFKLDAAIFEEFQEKHDPLKIFSLSKSMRYIYFFAFAQALADLEAQIENRP